MTAKNYPECLAITLDFEGGYSNDAGDPGGPTKYGITIHDVRQYLNPNATAADVKALTITQAKEIYRKHYWEPVSGDAWPEGLDLSVWDAGVNSGLGRAKPWAQRALGSNGSTFSALAVEATSLSQEQRIAAVKKYNAIRMGFLRGLKTWSIFGKGWGRRVSAIEALGVKMVLASHGVSKADQKSRLEKEASEAKEQKNDHQVTAGGGAAVGGTSFFADWGWPTFVLIGVVALLVAYSVYWALRHRERVEAYLNAAKDVFHVTED